MIVSRFRRELSIFNQLELNTKKLVLSNFCQTIANALIFVFVNAYMFVSTNNVTSVALFNLGIYISVLIGFYLNSYLIKFIKVKHLFIFGLITQGLSMGILFFFTALSLWLIFGIGLIVGLAFGLYWANRNFIYPSLTLNKERDYISGMDSLVSSTSGVVLPLLAGWLIVWARANPQLEVIGAYRLIMLFGIIVLLIGSLFLSSIKSFPVPKVTLRFVKKPNVDWKLFRIFVLAASAQGVIAATVPEVITLSFLGNEGVLGSIKAVLAIMTGLAMYFVGRKMKPPDRFKVLVTGNLPILLASIILLIKFNQLTIILYLILMSLGNAIFWFVYMPLFSKAVEIQNEGNMVDNYAYVLDHELFINLGRVSFLLFFLFAINFWGNAKGLTISIFLGAIAQSLALIIGRRLIGLHNLHSASVED